MPPNRRSVVLSAGIGLAAALTGCLAPFATGTGALTIASSYPDPIGLEIRVAPAYGAETTFEETIVVDPGDDPIDRREVVTGGPGETFYVKVSKESSGETFETIWEFECVEDADRPDRLSVTVTEAGEVRFSQDRCGAGFENPPTESDA